MDDASVIAVDVTWSSGIILAAKIAVVTHGRRLMDDLEARRRVAERAVARLATTRADGRPHIVPVCFALDGDTLVSVVDGKPKRSADLLRLANMRARPAVSLLVDHYDDDWAQLWWVRLDGVAEVLVDGAEYEEAIYAPDREVPAVPNDAAHRVGAAGDGDRRGVLGSHTRNLSRGRDRGR